MARGDAVRAALLQRIRTSTQTLTLEFPPVKAVSPSGPTALPASPMTGPARPVTLVPEAVDPEYPPLTLKCLWLDTALQESTNGVGVSVGSVGWIDGATALARVAWCDAAIDITAPDKGSWFDKAIRVVHADVSWRILKVERMGPGFREPHSLSIWLTGVNKM